MIAVFKREFLAYFRGIQGYLFVALFLLCEGFLVITDNFILQNPAFEYTLWTLSMVLVVLIPLLSMNSVSSDRRGHTDQLLCSLPLSAGEIVCGKYLATLCVYGISLGVTCLYVPLLRLFGKVNFLSAYASLFAFFLLGGALLALCVFLSSVSRHPAVAAVLGIAGCLLLFLLSLLASVLPMTPWVSLVILIVLILLVAGIAWLASGNVMIALVTAAAGILPASLVFVLSPVVYNNLAPRLILYLSPFYWFDCISQNLVFDLRGVVYLISFTVFFLFISAVSVGKRRS